MRNEDLFASGLQRVVHEEVCTAFANGHGEVDAEARGSFVLRERCEEGLGFAGLGCELVFGEGGKCLLD